MKVRTSHRIPEDVRLKIASMIRSTGNVAAVARKFKVTWRAVHEIRRKDAAGHDVTQDYARPGRPKIVKPAQAAAVRRAAKACVRTSKITSRVSKAQRQPISQKTVQRIMTEGRIALEYTPVNRGQVLRAANKQKRLDFCTQHETAQTSTWVFVDSKMLYLYNNKQGHLIMAWQDPHKKLRLPKNSKPRVLHFYGAVAKDFKSRLFFTDPTPPINSSGRRGRDFDSQSLIADVLPGLKHDIQQHFGSRPYRVVWDRASEHTSKAAKEAVQSIGLQLLQDFPPQSWDINIIENVWGVLAGKLDERRPVTNRGWQQAIKEEWGSIQQSTINKLVASVKPRMAQIVQLGGAWLKAYKSKH